MLCASYGKSCLDIYAVSGLKELAGLGVSRDRQTATFNDFCQFVSEQADLATDTIYSEEVITKPMDKQ